MPGATICDICNLQKRLTQTSIDFEQSIIKATINYWQWRARLRSRVRAGGGHFKHMVW